MTELVPIGLKKEHTAIGSEFVEKVKRLLSAPVTIQRYQVDDSYESILSESIKIKTEGHTLDIQIVSNR